MGVLIVDCFSLEGIHAQLSGLACPAGWRQVPLCTSLERRHADSGDRR